MSGLCAERVCRAELSFSVASTSSTCRDGTDHDGDFAFRRSSTMSDRRSGAKTRHGGVLTSGIEPWGGNAAVRPAENWSIFCESPCCTPKRFPLILGFARALQPRRQPTSQTATDSSNRTWIQAGRFRLEQTSAKAGERQALCLQNRLWSSVNVRSSSSLSTDVHRRRWMPANDSQAV